MPVAEAPIEKFKQELAEIDERIAAVERRKLITIVEPGGSDKVMFVQPYDLGDNDPDGWIEEWAVEVTDTDYDQGYAKHKTRRFKTGKKIERWTTDPGRWTGPFGHTYKIDTTVQDGQREWEAFKRTLETHVSRLSRVPEPVAYHSDVDENGVVDLRNLSITKEQVPVATLENYAPLDNLKAERAEVVRRYSEAGCEVPVLKGVESEPVSEAAAVARAQEHIFRCPEGGCEFVAKNTHGLNLHKTKKHGG